MTDHEIDRMKTSVGGNGFEESDEEEDDVFVKQLRAKKVADAKKAAAEGDATKAAADAKKAAAEGDATKAAADAKKAAAEGDATKAAADAKKAAADAKKAAAEGDATKAAADAKKAAKHQKAGDCMGADAKKAAKPQKAGDCVGADAKKAVESTKKVAAAKHHDDSDEASAAEEKVAELLANREEIKAKAKMLLVEHQIWQQKWINEYGTVMQSLNDAETKLKEAARVCREKKSPSSEEDSSFSSLLSSSSSAASSTSSAASASAAFGMQNEKSKKAKALKRSASVATKSDEVDMNLDADVAPLKKPKKTAKTTEVEPHPKAGDDPCY
jgi:hypothetical protein